MLALLRKYQKSIFIVTTLVVISTFVFYGAVRAGRGMIAHDKSLKESVLYQTPQGEKVTDVEIRLMAQFLNEEVDSLSQTPINMFNGEFVSSYLFEAGIGASLAKEFFADIEQPLKIRFQKMQNYRPYVHPAWPMMSAEKIWEIFAPGLSAAYKEFKESQKLDSETLISLQRLFVQSKQMPSSFLQQILSTYQNQNPQLSKDPGLYSQDLAMFHAHTLGDWFGKEFLELVSQFVINTASLAKQNGISFTQAEVKASLLQNGIHFIHTYGGKEVSANQVETLLEAYCFQKQSSEKELMNIWRQVMLCKAYLDRGNQIVFEPSFYQEYMKDTAKRLKVSLYQMPREFQIRNSEDYARVESYLSALFPTRVFTEGQWPTSLNSIQQIKDIAPELVYRKVVLNISEVTLDEAKSQISLKQLWDYETSDEGWKKVLALAPVAKEVHSKGDRFAFIKSLPADKKHEIDDVCKMEMVQNRPEVLNHLLSQKQMQEKSFIIPYSATKLPIKGFASSEELFEFCLSLKEPTVISKDPFHLYNLSLVSIGQDEVMTFAEALNEGTIDALVERNLISFFDQHKHKHASLKNAEFDEVKAQIAELKYPPAKAVQQRFGQFLIAVAELKKVAPESSFNSLISQFTVKEETQTWSRGQNNVVSSDEIWKMAPGSAPTLIQLKDQSIAALKVEEVFEDQKMIEEAIAKGRKSLENIARKEKADQILMNMKTLHTYSNQL